MRGGREEDGKVMIPLFPRLHVNDADKGGPRAPPRNKMALYEQLNVPSQRFKHVAVPRMVPLSSSQNSAAAPVPSAASSQVYGHERSLRSSHYSSCQTPHLTEKASLSSEARNSSSLRQVFGRRSARHVGRELVNPRAHLQSNEQGLTSTLNSSRKVYEDDDDFRVPNFNLSGKDQHASEGSAVHTEISQGSVANYNSSTGLSKDHDNHQRHPVSIGLKSKKHGRSGSEQEPEESAPPKVQKQNPTSTVRSGEKNAHALNIQKAWYLENAAVKFENQKMLLNAESKLHGGSTCNGNWGASRCSTETEVAENGDLSKVKIVSLSKTLNTSNPQNLDKAEDYNENEDKKSGLLGNDDMEKIEDGSDTSMVESDPGFDISPDDVVNMIGAKHFWKARRAIGNQQRVFAVQVFELHRLMKVQKLIAASPNLLLEENSCLHKSSKVQAKINSSEQNMKSQPQNTKQKDESHKTNNGVHSENKPTTISHPSQDDNFNRSCVSQNTKGGPHPGNPTPVISPVEQRTNPWCFHPQGNQWLVPVMSPSEGLVFKPYMGSFPPPGGFMAPVFGGYGSVPMPTVGGDFMNAAYGFPASHQPQNLGIIPGNPAIIPHYFPAPFCLSVANPTSAGSAIEQTMLPTGHNEQQSHNSCDTPNPRMEAISGSAQKIQASTDSEFYGSTASSPSDRALPFLPVPSVTECSDQPVRGQSKDHRTQVIKVVPHNAMSATESAARIFRCIQKERLQFD